MKILRPKNLNAGDKKILQEEEPIEDVQFNIFKFNSRPKPQDKRQVIIISTFAEFGCETLGVMYCLPQLLQRYPGKYKIAMGWYGRDYLYRHLVDEFWEVREEHQHLREQCRAFHHESKNLAKIEQAASAYGVVIPSHILGRYAIGVNCMDQKCKNFWSSIDYEVECPKCHGTDVEQSLLGDIPYWKERAIHVPFPSKDKLSLADKYLKPNSVGVFGRGRICYGRNLQPEFYIKLIDLLENKGYNPIWLGEKQSTLPCPVDHILDFSRMPEARDLELTLAIVSKLKFTVQFWTASTRLAGMMGVPYLLFESPDQIWGSGQEGRRRTLCDSGPSKLAINHYLNVYKDNESALEIVKRCIEEMEQGNYDDVVGLVESESVVETMRSDYAKHDRQNREKRERKISGG